MSIFSKYFIVLESNLKFKITLKIFHRTQNYISLKVRHVTRSLSKQRTEDFSKKKRKEEIFVVVNVRRTFDIVGTFR